MLEQLLNTLIRMTIHCIMLAIIEKHLLVQLVEPVLPNSAIEPRKSTFECVVKPPAHHLPGQICGRRREALAGKCMRQGTADVLNGIDQRPVQIEKDSFDNRFLHRVIIRYAVRASQQTF